MAQNRETLHIYIHIYIYTYLEVTIWMDVGISAYTHLGFYHKIDISGLKGSWQSMLQAGYRAVSRIHHPAYRDTTGNGQPVFIQSTVVYVYIVFFRVGGEAWLKTDR